MSRRIILRAAEKIREIGSARAVKIAEALESIAEHGELWECEEIASLIR